jgi:ubiquinone/menaquinone biosynthesis C-methylase UbiE
MRLKLILPKKSDYPNGFKILDQAGRSAAYHQLVEASASAYFETKGPAKWLFMKRFEIAVEYLNQIGPVDNLLDAGTGIGFFLPTLSRAAQNAWSLDYAQHTLKYAKALTKKLKVKNVKFVQGDLTKLPFKAKQFDVVVALSILEHIPPKQLPVVIGHFERALKPGGYLIAGYPNEGSRVFKLVQQAEKIIMRPKMFKSIHDDKRKYKPLGHVALSWQIDKAIRDKLKVVDYDALPFKGLKFYSLSLNQKA